MRSLNVLPVVALVAVATIAGFSRHRGGESARNESAEVVVSQPPPGRADMRVSIDPETYAIAKSWFQAKRNEEIQNGKEEKKM